MLRTRLILPAMTLLAYSCAVGAQGLGYDPPSRVARLAYSSGDVQFAPAGETLWDSARRNRPLVTGDRLLTGSDGRAALEMGDSAVRINDNSAFDLLNLDDRTAQIELSQGALNLRVRNLAVGQTYEVDTPVLAFVAGQPGDYRLDVAPDGNGTIVTVFAGSGTVYGENGASLAVYARHSYHFDDAQLINVSDDGLPPADSFDRFSFARDSRYMRSPSRRYVSADVIGYDDLDANGDWQASSNYGEVWYPTHVASDWAPYRDGRWEWVDPYGWTWIDNTQWGFAPYHYGRWVYVQDRWGWIPGEQQERAVYAPALVAFFGGSGLGISLSIGNSEPVGWFPLGPNDVYLPPYQVSRNYFNNINVTNIRVVNNTVINNTIINNYYSSYNNPNAAQHINYAYRATPQAVTVVPQNVFAGARAVTPAMLSIKPGALVKANIQPTPHVTPSLASLGGKLQVQPAGNPGRAFARPVVARTAPPPPPMPFAAREKMIASRGGAPIPMPQLRQLQQNRANSEPLPPHVRLIAPSAAGALQPIAAHAMPNGAMRAPGTVAGQPVLPARTVPMRPGELPSARFAARPGATGAAQMPGMGQSGASAPRANANTGIVPPSMRRAAPVQSPAIGSNAGRPLPAAAAPAMGRRGDGFVHAPTAPERNAPAIGGLAPDQAHLIQQRAAQQQAAQAQQQRAAQSNALQTRAAEDRAAQIRAAQEQRAATERTTQMQAQAQAERMAAQQRVAADQAARAQGQHAAEQRNAQQAQQAERAAQERATQMQAQRAAGQERAAQAQQQQAQRAAAQERAAQMQAQRAAAEQQRAAQLQDQRAAIEQQRAAQMQAQRAVVEQQRAAQMQAQAQQRQLQLQRQAPPPAKKPQPAEADPNAKKKDNGQGPPGQ